MASSRDYLDFILEQLSGLGDVENREFLCNLLESMYSELPEPKRKK
ncbi:MAG: hypothetical protein IKP61_02140 [Spirochaetales bacterium]|nr:hypothetical protein [Spirochaetales bacterium]